MGAEGEEHLFTGTVEHFQHVVLGVFFVEIEPPLIFIRFTFSSDFHGTHHAHRRQNGCQSKEQLIGLGQGKQGERTHDHQIAHQGSDLTDRILDTLGSAASALPGVLQGQGALHAQLNVLTQRIYADGQRCQHLACRQQGMHTHAAEHDHSTGFEQCLCRQHIERCQNKHQGNAGQFPEEFRNAPVHFPHFYHFRQIIVKHTLVKAVGQAGNQNTQEKIPESGAFPVDLPDGVSLFHSFFHFLFRLIT